MAAGCSGGCAHGVCVRDDVSDAWACNCEEGWARHFELSLAEETPQCTISLTCLSAQYTVVLTMALLTALLTARGLWLAKLDAIRGGADLLAALLIFGLCASGLGRGGPTATLSGWVALYLANYGAASITSASITLRLNKYVRVVKASAARLQHRDETCGEESSMASETALALASLAVVTLAFYVAIFVSVLSANPHAQALVTVHAIESSYMSVVFIVQIVYAHIFLSRLAADLAFAEEGASPGLAVKIKQLKRKLKIMYISIVVSCLVLLLFFSAHFVLSLMPAGRYVARHYDEIWLTPWYLVFGAFLLGFIVNKRGGARFRLNRSVTPVQHKRGESRSGGHQVAPEPSPASSDRPSFAELSYLAPVSAPAEVGSMAV
jgi:hypothetical protein